MQRSCSFAGRLHPVQAWRPSSRIVRDLQGSLLASFRPVAALHCQVIGESNLRLLSLSAMRCPPLKLLTDQRTLFYDM